MDFISFCFGASLLIGIGVWIGFGIGYRVGKDEILTTIQQANQPDSDE